MRAYTTALAVTGFVTLSILGTVSAGSAQSVAPSGPGDTRLRVELADRQYIQAQRLSRAVCMLELGVDAHAERSQLKSAKDAFDNVLKGLRDSDDTLGLSHVEDRPAILSGFSEVEARWARIDRAVNVMLLLDRYEAPFSDTVYAETTPLAEEMTRLARAISKADGLPKIEELIDQPPYQMIRDQIGLVEKIGKEMCLVALDWEAPATRSRLAGSIRRFEDTLDALRQAIRPATPALPVTTDPAADTFVALEASWQTLRHTARQSSLGHPLLRGELAEVALNARQMQTLLQRLAQENGPI